MIRDRSLILIDAVGALSMALMIGAVGWFVFLKPDTASSQLQALVGEVRQLNTDLERLQSALDGQSSQQRDLLKSAESLGRLPSKSPIDQDLQRITSLAARHDVKVMEVSPTSTVNYPNVLETRYSLRAEAAFEDYLGFLRDFEQCSFWGDVTYLSFQEAPKAAKGVVDAGRPSELTVSFYSAFQ